MDFFNLTFLECSLLIGLGAFFFIQILFYACVYNQLHRLNNASRKGTLTYADSFAPLSVIIAAKDAGSWLKTYLPTILKQDYPCFEIIVVNDGSVDDTEEVLKLLESEYPHLYHTFTPATTRYVSRKKLSLTLGIRAAKYDWLVFVEPFTTPVGPNWLKSLARNFTPTTDIVLGYSNYQSAKGYFNRKITFDQLLHSLRYLGCAALRIPYTGMGTNLAYRKSLYYAQKGYSSHLNLQRGEDDLFINEAATSKNTRVECSADSVIRMLPPQYKKSWIEEKVGRMATEHLHKGFQHLFMALESGSRYLFLLGCIALWLHAIYYQHWFVGILAFVMWALRYAYQLWVFKNLSTDLHERRFVFSLLWFDWLQPLWNLHYKWVYARRRKSEFMRR